MCIWKKLILWWFKPCENCLKLMWVFWVDIGPPMHVSATCGWCRNVPMCHRNLPKCDALGHNRRWHIDLPTPHVFVQLSPVLGAGTLLTGVSIPSKGSGNVLLCLRNIQNIFGAWGPNRSWDIDPHLPHVFHQLSPVLGTSSLPTGMSTPVKWSKMFLCASGPPKIGVREPNGSWDIDIPTPPCICSTQSSFGCQHSVHRCVNTS